MCPGQQAVDNDTTPFVLLNAMNFIATESPAVTSIQTLDITVLHVQVDRQGIFDINTLAQDRVVYVIISTKLSGDRNGKRTPVLKAKAGFVNW